MEREQRGIGRSRRTIGAGRRFGLLTMVFAMLALLMAPVASAQESQIEPVDGGATESADDWSPPTTVYIPETGHTIDGVFLDWWRANNGIENYGYPITVEHEHKGRIVQYYTYARFEYVPDDPNGQIVHIANVGEELRPKTLPRLTMAKVESRGSAATELAQMQRAWLPLDGKAAKRENSDTYRYVEETQHSVSHGFKEWWESIGESYLGNPLSEEYVLKGVTYQTFERGQLAWTKKKGVWLVPIGEVVAKKYDISTAPVDQGDIPTYSEDLFVAPETPKKTPRSGNGGERWIEINLSSQYLIAWEGDVPVAETYVSTGRPGFDTPPGTFFVQSKLESQTMEGVLGGEYYNVPDVPYVQYFTEGGHALHGAYWHANFGAVMSHGCVNAPVDFAAWLYGWTSIGTRIEIHY